jgi:hypothetical protein
VPPIHRPTPLRYVPVRIDVSLLEAIEELAAIDCAASPDVIANLWARADAEWDAGRDPERDDKLCADVADALDGHWLSLWETRAIQRLRGWHRARYGLIEVDARWLTAVRNVLDNFTLSFDDRCEETAEEYGIDRVRPVTGDSPAWPGPADARTEVLALMSAYNRCGECDWCRSLTLRTEVDAVLDAAGFDGGVYYRAYCLGETQEQLAEHYGWKKAA